MGEGKSQRTRVLVNTLTGWSSVVARSIINLLLVPFLIRSLGEAGYGLIGLVGVLAALAGIADLGLRSALGRELSEKVARNDVRGFRELCSTALALYLAISGIMALSLYVLAPWLVNVFKVTPSLQDNAILLLRTYGMLSIVISFITPVASAALTSFMRFDAINILQTASGAVSALFLFAFLSLSSWNPLFVWAWVMAGIMIFNLVGQWILFRQWCFGGQVGFRFLNPSQLKSLFHVGGYMFVSQLANMISDQSNPLIISFFLGNGRVALYQPGYSISSPIRAIVSTLTAQLHPLTTRYHAEKNERKIQDILLAGTRYSLFLGSLFSAGLIVFAEPFARLWLGNSLGAGSLTTVAKVLQLCAIIDFLAYCGGAQWPVLLGMKKLSFILWSNVPAALLTVGLSIYFVGFTSLGVPGVLIGAVVARLLRNVILINYTPRLCGLTPWRYFRDSILIPCVCLGATVLLGITVRSMIPASCTWPLLITAGCITGAGWLLFVLLFGLQRDERAQLIGIVRTRLAFL